MNGVHTSDVQVQLRFTRIEKQTKDVKDVYPPFLEVKLNGERIRLQVILHVLDLLCSLFIGLDLQSE